MKEADLWGAFIRFTLLSRAFRPGSRSSPGLPVERCRGSLGRRDPDAGPPKLSGRRSGLDPGSPTGAGRVRRPVIPVEGTRELALGLKHQVSGRIPINEPFSLRRPRRRSRRRSGRLQALAIRWQTAFPEGSAGAEHVPK